VIYAIGEEISRRVDGAHGLPLSRRLALSAKASWKWWVGYSLGVLGLNHYRGDDRNGVLQVAVATVIFILIVVVGAVQHKEVPNTPSDGTR